ncbi:serine/threonine-protein kinase [Sorangium sp. So ce1389]|uniref:serine/threonine-protein kinase n=1 Tax=Sorangium sp. So ce1389 TaxID=3133336 RepID=UPI003F630315
METTHTAPVSPAIEGASCPIGPGDVLAGRYAVEHLVGEGTFAWVFAALDVQTAPLRRVALKVLRPERAGEDCAPRRVEAREIALLVRVHAARPAANVVRPLSPEVIAHRGVHVLLLELIEGPSLAEMLAGPETLGPAQARRIGAGIARGLSAIHAAGEVHRDLKPSNIRLRAEGEPVILDLGIARAMQEDEAPRSTRRAWMTPRYAAPEQLAGDDACQASDVYALGLILHEMFTGRLPAEPPAPRRALPGDIDCLVRRCLAPRPALRPTAAEVEAALSAGPSAPALGSAGRWRPAWSGVALLVLAGWVSGHLAHSDPGWASAPPALAGARSPALDTFSGADLVDGDGRRPGPPWEGAPVLAMRLGDDERQAITAVAADAGGDLCVTGHFRGTVDLGAVRLQGAGYADVFVARLDPAGEVLWARRFGDAEWQASGDIALDRAGNAFVTGTFRGAIDFGQGPLRNPAGEDIFVAKLDAAGNALWSKRFGDGSEQGGGRVAVDEAGDVVVAGQFSGSVDLGDGALRSAGRYDIFLAKLDADGNTRWSRRLGDAAEQLPYGLGIDAQGNIFLIGAFDGTIDLDGERLTSAGSMDVFVARFDADGRPRWGRRFGSPEHNGSFNAIVDATGNVTIAGSFRGTMAIEGRRLTSAGGNDIFVARMDADGHLLWIRRMGGPGDDLGTLAASVDGEPIVLGRLDDSIDWRTGVRRRLVAARFDAAGEPTWIQGVGGEGGIGNLMAAVAGANDLILAGSFEGSLSLGAPDGAMRSAGDTDIFVARFPLAAEGSTPGADGARP